MPARDTYKHKQIEQQRLESAEFIQSLAGLFALNHGSVYLTQKRLAFDTTNAPDEKYDVLFRATDRKSARIATAVDAAHLPAFLEKYAETCRAGMSTGLKKRVRKKKEKKTV